MLSVRSCRFLRLHEALLRGSPRVSEFIFQRFMKLREADLGGFLRLDEVILDRFL